MLLDTHVLVWARADSGRLGPTAWDELASQTVYFSPVSLVELHVKTMSGKLDLPPAVLDDPSVDGFVELSLRTDQAAALAELPELTAHDPFDRMLVAQALATRMKFLTADRRLLALQKKWILDARA